MTDTVQVDARGGVRIVRLNRPERLNAMVDELLEGLLTALEEAAADPHVRVVVLTGAGRGFCAGGDLAAIGNFRADLDAPERAASLRRLQRSSQLLHDMPKLTIAAVNGPCAGAGLSLATATDLRFAARSAVFRTAFIGVSLTGDFGATWSLPRIVGGGRARELFFLDRRIDADEARSIGLVTDVFPDEGFLELVLDEADRLAARPANVLAGIKANLNDGEGLDFAAALDREAVRQVAAVDAAVAAAKEQVPTPVRGQRPEGAA